LPGDEIAEAVRGAEVKAALRAANDEAVARGVCGVPTFCVGATLFWGDDRLEAAAALAGRSRTHAAADQRTMPVTS
jgi:2-hydroxychromene-2-carboxylate isomerase